MGGPHVKADEGKREDLMAWDWAGEGLESILDQPDGARFLRGQKGIRTGRRRLIVDVGPCAIKEVKPSPVSNKESVIPLLIPTWYTIFI